ncbi:MULTISPECIES: T9SS type A sorting domain-containing protein [unclassified Lentimicrobium]|uniref:T9SS type A sorting domain-containing protein n=1 Tax=unclassified Lentimicrobium TaxID=2677434 RepID=UPI001554F375|nr:MULTISPECIES: T9SS type A sorting domain-containing protein [unclassified Lentimicrobium]NPD44463.1 T9SS type A sorting domain-containing protein [Lentimicrobium sp. S6]NPD84237.1 T9SS type A sorting domain-containing protein [Lentimicrobium sp. L6]
MKKNLLLLLMLVMSIGLFAQDWAPINSTERFCYSSDDTLDMINNVLWVETFEEVDDAQVYHLNKIAIPFENGEGSLFLYNQPQFLLDDVWVFPDGDWVFQDTFFLPIEELETYTLKPNASLNDSWDFAGNITATISEIGMMDLFGQEDSIKTILVSNGLGIILSKNHGIVNWNNEYQLIGIEGRDLGFQVPNFEDMYAEISAGDVICYHINNWAADDQTYGWISDVRYDIENVTRYEDSIVFNAFVRTNTDWYWKSSNQISTKGYEDIVVYRNRFTDAYPNDTLFIQGGPDMYNYSEGIAISKLSNFKWGGLKKTQFTYEGDWPFANLMYHDEGLYSFELYPVGESMLMEHSVEYGFLEYVNFGFEWGGERELVGVIDNGDTLGYIHPLDIFTGQKELSINNNSLVFPSPAKESITIQSQETGEYNYQVFNISGQLVLDRKQEKTLADLEIDISDLHNGVYILQIAMNNQIIRKKFIKQM